MRTCALARVAVALWVAGSAGAASGGESAGEREQKTRRLVADGLNRFNVGEYDEAAKRFTEAYLLQPLPELLYDLGQIAAKQGRSEKAIELYRRYQNTLPVSSSSQARSIDAKIDGLHQSIAQESVEQQAARRLRSGRALLAHGRLEDAEEELNGGFALAQRPTFLVALGDLARQRNDRTTAMAHYRNFLAAAPANDPERPYVRTQLDALEPPPARPVEQKRSRRRLWWIAAPAAVVVAGIVVAIYFGSTSNSSSVPVIPISPHN